MKSLRYSCSHCMRTAHLTFTPFVNEFSLPYITILRQIMNIRHLYACMFITTIIMYLLLIYLYTKSRLVFMIHLVIYYKLFLLCLQPLYLGHIQLFKQNERKHQERQLLHA